MLNSNCCDIILYTAIGIGCIAFGIVVIVFTVFRIMYLFHELFSDGMDHVYPSPLLFKSQDFSTTACDRMFFLPCTDNIGTYLMLVALYGYVMFIGERHIRASSKVLFKTMGTGVFGTSVFQLLGALPQAMIILVSGLSRSKEVAQENLMIGVGIVAGSAITLLTLIWGTCIVVGKSDLTSDSISNDLESLTLLNRRKEKQSSFLTGSGVRTDEETRKIARIMVLSVTPFIIVQIPNVFKSYSWERTVILIGLITSIVLLLYYFIYQRSRPWIQMRKLEYVKLEYLMPDILQHVKNHALGNLLTDTGAPNVPAIEWLFDVIDINKDEAISRSECHEVLKGFNFGSMSTEDAIAEFVNKFDADNDGKIDKNEFINGMKKYVKEPNRADVYQPSNSEDLTDKVYQEKWEKTDELVEENRIWTCCLAVLQLLFGMVILTLLSEPLVVAVQNFSKAANIPPFFISFIVVPLVTNSREAVSAIISAHRKNQRTCSLTFSEIYGNVVVNNLLGLSIFLFLVYARGLTWNFSAEVVSVLMVCMVMGLLASFRVTFPLWTCLVAYLLYPFSLILVYVLEYIFGWSS